MASSTLTINDVADMIRHWLSTPVDGYLGSGYGSNLKDLLQQPLNTALADAFLAKLTEDVPILAKFPPGQLNLWAENVGKETLRIVIDLGVTQLSIDSLGNVA
ncbi:MULTISPECIES: hypothetical protein [Pseudomonas]|uniref:Uncharacterized protein n=1 Tax=Pseudomonas lutea TaxID=243924 RepID=A0A9X8MH17_9PSED|nr:MULTISPECIES: hypothetical protein [Pseudomonas]SER36012.1 hypothetical protein SAMN05216409_11834 [Pseudomonas lutea]